MFKTDLAMENWASKYRYKNETPIGTFQRIARALASVEKKEEQDHWYDAFLKLMVRIDENGDPTGLKFTPGGRITSNIGTDYKNATAINCFVTGPVSEATVSYRRKSSDNKVSYDVKYETDDNPDDLINIFLTILEQAKTLASEGGYGINFDFIRPRGSLIKGIGVKHPGVIAYMQIWDMVSECIVRGTNDGYLDKLKNYLKNEEEVSQVKKAVKAMARKGAMLSALSVSHPDIEEYVRAKQSSGVLTKFNMSVLITDEFMQAVERDDFFDLSFKGVVSKRLKARDLYNLIMESCYNRAEPGILFYDNMHKNNPVAYLGRCNCSNPCLHGDSLLLTKKGLKKIKSLKDISIEIWNGAEWSTSRIVSTGVKPVYELRMSNGMYLRGTEDHIVEADTAETPIANTIGKEITRIFGSAWEGVPVPYTNNELVCLGFAFGDSNYHEASGRFKYVYIGEKDFEVESLFNEIGESLEEERRYDKRTISFSFSEKCEKLNFPKATLPYRYLSDEILCLPPNQLKQFLKGLFSANGCVLDKHSRVTLKTSCKTLVEQLQVALLALGIKSYFTKNKAHIVEFSNGEYSCKESYDLNITSDDVAVFREIIGFVQKYKTEKINSIEMAHGRRKKPKVVSLTYVGEEEVYDFSEPITHWAFVNGLKTHNCGEVVGLPTLTTVCLLGSVNLTQYVYKGMDGRPRFNLDEYKQDIRVAVRMLDNVNDVTNSPLPSYTWAIKNLRQIGIGLNGVGSALMMLHIPYNSEEGVKFIEELNEIKENLTWQQSALLAKEKGAFKAYIKKDFEGTEYFKSDRLSEETKDLLKKHGARNAKTTTNPPLGNSSIICDNVSNGIEPVFSLEQERKIICKDWPEGLTTDNVKDLFKVYKEKDYKYWKGEYKGKTYYFEPHNRGLCEVVPLRDYGYQWILDNYPEDKKAAFVVTTEDLEIEDHLNIQEAVQKHINQSVSKTVNLPKNYPFAKYKELYIEAWKRGLIGFTTYRAGSMESVLSDISKAEDSREIIKRDIKLPKVFVNGPTSIIKKEGKKFYIHFSYLPEDTDMSLPVCMWIYTNAKYQEKDDLKICNKAARELAKLAYKCGIDEKIIEDSLAKAKEDHPHNRLGRMISLNLRHNVPREKVLVSITGIEGDSVSSLLTAVRKFIGETIPDGTPLEGLKCDCGGSLVMEAACKRCVECKTQFCG
jgi:ribonucleoside-diphosphate reductase alpha chain